ncbi:MAG: 16S rRNA (guanine(527)-N(7))-methyltransferase RsmG [bacterium]
MWEIYLNELIAWNKKFNLTAITGPEEIRIKHFADSLSISQSLDLAPSSAEGLSIPSLSVIDIGTGAGFPGIPLKIQYPNIKLTLLEATKKKTLFLEHIIELLNLKDVEVVWGRAEEVAKQRREEFDLAVARAVAKLNVLTELCLPFVKVGGLFVAYKAENVEAEVVQAENAIKTLGGKLKEIKKIKLSGTEIIHSLVIIEKITPTQEKYPRHPSLAIKKPL